MSFYTELFLVNWVLLLFIVWFDSSLLDSQALVNTRIKRIMGMWGLISFCSIPVWLIYIIVTW